MVVWTSFFYTLCSLLSYLLKIFWVSHFQTNVSLAEKLIAVQHSFKLYTVILFILLSYTTSHSLWGFGNTPQTAHSDGSFSKISTIWDTLIQNCIPKEKLCIHDAPLKISSSFIISYLDGSVSLSLFLSSCDCSWEQLQCFLYVSFHHHLFFPLYLVAYALWHIKSQQMDFINCTAVESQHRLFC